MGGLLKSREVILAKTESTYNTDSVPTAGSNAILVRNVNWASAGLRMNERPAVRSSIGKLQRIHGGTLKSVSMEVEMKGSGTIGTAPEIGPLLTACGMSETVVAVTSVTYKPDSGNSTPHKSISMYFFEGGRKRHILTGCRGTVSFSLEAGGIMIASFVFTGHYTEPTDQSQPSPTYNSTVPRAVLGMVVALNGVTAIVAKSWSFALNNTIAMPPSIAATDGYGEILITDRDVTGEITIESELDSVLDVDALLSAGTRFAFASGTLGSSSGNRVALTTPASSTYATDTSLQEADGVQLRQIPLAVDDSTSDQEISLVFT